MRLLDHYQTWDNGIQQCHRCGRKLKTPSPTRWKCCHKDQPVKQSPNILQKAAFLAAAVAQFGLSGMATVDEEEYKRRLNICGGCDYRRGAGCLVCGCNMHLKAQGKTFNCDMGLWNIEESENDSKSPKSGQDR